MCNCKKGITSIDPCMKKLIRFINAETNYTTIYSCCGHSRYSKTLIIKRRNSIHKTIEVFSGKIFLNKKRYYISDKNGYYFIPEIDKEIKCNNPKEISCFSCKDSKECKIKE